jgi:hypothetical protein
MSPDQILWTGAVPPLEPGADATGSATVARPVLATGPFTLFVMADAGSEVAESREWDNVMEQQLVSGPDLWVTLSVPPVVSADSPFSARVRVKNVGDETAGPSIVRLYRSADGDYDADDTLLSVFNVGSLAPLAAEEHGAPAVLPRGAWWLIAIGEASASTPDARDTNNIRRIRIDVP